MAKDAETVRWLHLSDFHVGKDDYATRKMFDYITAHVRKRKAEGFVPDLLFITGDLADKGLPSQYETIWQDFILPLQQEIGGNIEHRTFVVPGNHDVDRTKYPAFSQADIAKSDSHYLDPTDEGARLRGEMLIPRFQAYLDNDLTPIGDAFAKQAGAFAECFTIHGQEVGIVGINTAWLSKDKDERQLTPGKPLLEKALDTIKSAKLRIVLGHHPIDWFIPAQQKPIKSLLGQHQVLYLHGHLHDSWAEPSYGGGRSYLTIQAGAGFQAREGQEPWRNGLVWGDADLDAGEVRLQPCRWIPDQQAWTPATDAFHEAHRRGEWWHYQLPGNQEAKVDYTPSKRVAQPPRGFKIFKPDDLAIHLLPLEEGAALRYFDGAVPDWPTALSASISRRGIVGTLAERFRQASASDRPLVTLLLAAGCEGKTTAILQAAYTIVEGKSDWRILQRRDESQPLVPNEIVPLLNKDYKWLLLLDEADQVASELLELFKQLPQTLHGRVHALMCCRDTDWLASPAKNIDWSTVAFQNERLTGLELTDAQAIVQSWRTYGIEGLGDLAEQPEAEQAIVLVNQAKDETRAQSGAFFGALLAVRSGSDLRRRARRLLDRLGQRAIPGGRTLRDALAYIAAMDAEGLEYLSRPVLAEVLKCPESKLHRDVLVPLGQEAAATTTSQFIFTRHRHIAEALTSVLEEELNEDIGALYVALGEAAISAFLSGSFVPQLGSWRFNFSDHFLSQGNDELALNIARRILSREPKNVLTRTHVAHLFRKTGVPEQAIRIFREVTTLVEDRSFYYEWGVAEGEFGNHGENILLAAYAMSDQCSTRQIDNENATKCLSGLGVPLGALYDAYRDPIFRDARMAAAVLGLTMRPVNTCKGYLEIHARETAVQGASPSKLDLAIPLLQVGFAAAEKIGMAAPRNELVPAIERMTFEGLKKLTFHFANAKKA
ncbi:hypothetical protein BFW91_13670 [Pseudomonas fluorescens]|jgi:tetratricopeptide (TPR) repeat protein/predicted MPP superfamily phosphohydrolase|uniref:metallophosphoesterase family protein n=1 Tax=Pseudomonas fluorescens TaxID=294 RepID=UPI00099B7179|nr:metallophosphoesterase [Pseudomonas fluorescens]NNB71530.1 metallophosphoesterase [Pseudomonas fluorescens]OPB10512.1 hypothetical protein BFW91_13670 [Pseudomonas fluorescens]